ncbi:MAG: hypothetical protein WBO10_03800 [Pyrinomonadaceae bacterium]
MRRSSILSAISFLSVAFIVIVIGKYVIVAQAPVTGNWKADARSEKMNDDGKLHISFERATDRGRNNQGSNFAFEDLQGLTRSQTQNGRVAFSLVREAGTVECEGAFTDGKGSGTFRFTPSQAYIGAMRSRGFDFEKDRHSEDGGIESRLLSAALLHVTTALADDLNSAGFSGLDVDDLFKAAIFKVDSKFMAEMKASGFPNLTMEDLVKARIFKIDADYVRQVHEMGFSDKGFEALVKFRIFKVTPEFLGELKAAGLSGLDSEDIVKCRIFKIDADFVRSARAADPNATIEDMVQMKIGVHKIKITE